MSRGSVRGKWRLKFLPLFLERPGVWSSVDPCCCEGNWSIFGLSPVSSCSRPSIPAEFICSLSPTHDTHHMCLLVLASKHLYRGQFPPPPTLGIVSLSSQFNLVLSSLYTQSLKSLPLESCLSGPSLAPRTPLLYSFSNTVLFALISLSHVCLCP